MTKPRALSSRAQMRLFVGLLVQPFFAAALTFVAFPLIDLTGRPLYGGQVGNTTDAAISLSLGIGIAAALVTILVVFPTVVWVATRVKITLGRAVLFGVFFGNLPVVIGTLLAGSYGAAGFVRASTIGTVLGASGAALFWVVSIRGQSFDPDEQAG